MDLTQNESSNEDPLSHCRACLSSDVRLFNMHQYKLDNAFANITGISVDKDQLQQYLCVYCGTQVLKSASFRDMCLRAHQSLTSEQAKDKINIEVIRKINSSNQFLDLTLTEIQIIECIDIASAETAIESIDVIPADTAIESIDVTPANTAIESIDVTPANAAIECIDVTPANTAIGNIDVTSSVDIPPTDTTITCIDTTDIDLPLNDIDPEDINITLEPNLDFADIEEKKRRNNQPKNGYKNKKPVLNISNNKNLKTNVKSVGKKNDEKISYEILKVLNANDNLHKQSVKLDQTDGITEKTDSKPSVMRKRRIEDSKTNDEKLKLNKKRKIRNPNVKFVGVDGIIKKIDSKVEYENQMQVLNISKDKLKYIKSRMRTIGDSLKKKMKIVIGENNDGSPGDIKINVETKTNVEVNGVSNVGIIRMPIKMRQENLRKDALKKIDMKMMLKSRKKIARYKIRRKPENNYLPVFDFAKFESDYNVKIVTLSKEEQLEEIASRKKSKKYSYQCEACGKGFNMELAYNNHIIRHNPVCIINIIDRSEAKVYVLTRAFCFRMSGCSPLQVAILNRFS
ncbi:uncharacterized protein LOC134677546 [Cydia fagiglandana]|uniref:uncharacterized protein LOC134677546 n=1 Tax=Cydia fagiglandana TaxID=1458189 RepID=UPI002FEE4C2E